MDLAVLKMDYFDVGEVETALKMDYFEVGEERGCEWTRQRWKWSAQKEERI